MRKISLFVILLFSLSMMMPMVFAQELPKSTEPEKKLSDKEMLNRSQEYLKKMRNIYKEILNLLEEARKEKDIVKIKCINENLTAIKALLKIAEQADVSAGGSH